MRDTSLVHQLQDAPCLLRINNRQSQEDHFIVHIFYIKFLAHNRRGYVDFPLEYGEHFTIQLVLTEFIHPVE